MNDLLAAVLRLEIAAAWLAWEIEREREALRPTPAGPRYALAA